MAIGGAIQYAETMTNPEPRWANAKRTAEYMGVHLRTVQRMATNGTITARRIEGNTRYDLNEVDARLRSGTSLTDLDADDATAVTAADVIARIRAALPAGHGKPLIPLVQVHAALDRVAEDLGVGRCSEYGIGDHDCVSHS